MRLDLMLQSDNGRKAGKGSCSLIANAHCHEDGGEYIAIHGPLVSARYVARCRSYPEAAGASVFNPRPNCQPTQWKSEGAEPSRMFNFPGPNIHRNKRRKHPYRVGILDFL